MTQSTIDRVHNLDVLLERWTGPVSVCIYSSDINGDLKKIAKWKDRIDFHFSPQTQGLYPVNTLRNVALDNARTDFVFLADIDFMPNVGSHEYLLKLIHDFPPFKKNKAILIAPAFMHYHGSEEIPKTKTELLRRMKLGEIDMVHRDPGRLAAHNATNYPRWAEESEPFRITYKFPYEPYFMAPKGVPRYDVTFVGYGNDKTEQTFELNEAG